MNRLQDRVADRDVQSIFLYTNEAHPGERYPHHTSRDQKFRHARALRDELGVNRPILVDSLEGDCHRAFGSMPNMTWILDRRGTVMYKSDWTDSLSVERALDALLELPGRRKGGERVVPFLVQRVEYRSADRDEFFRGLERAGPKAVNEFRKVFGGPREF